MAFIEAEIAGDGSGSANVKTGTGTYDGTNEVFVNVGFKPKYIAICADDTTNRVTNIYNADISTTQCLRGYESAVMGWVALTNTSSYYRIKSVTNNGFSVVGYVTSSFNFRYFAIG